MSKTGDEALLLDDSPAEIHRKLQQWIDAHFEKVHELRDEEGGE